MKIVDEKPNDVSISDMLDGQIGVVTKWTNDSLPIGSVVQRYNNDIIVFGRPGTRCYSGCCLGYASDLRVRILPPGTILEI